MLWLCNRRRMFACGFSFLLFIRFFFSFCCIYICSYMLKNCKYLLCVYLEMLFADDLLMAASIFSVPDAGRDALVIG